jgi:hypothetical protein
MSGARRVQVSFRGRSLGITVLTAAQIFIGVVHAFFGLLLLALEDVSNLKPTVAYDVYTVVFGVLVTFFAVLVWQGKKSGWVGTVAVLSFVVVADSLALLGLPTIPGIPKAPAIAEIAYSIVVIAYLCTDSVRNRYLPKVI